MGSSRNYMREYMRRRRNSVSAHCACGSKAFRMVNGNEGICKRCWVIEDSREALCKKAMTGKKWSEPEPLGGAKYWKEKLEMWLPNPTPGWGSLAMIEAKLRILQSS